MDALPSLATLLAFTAAALVLTITPGPDMTLFLSRTLQHGRRAGAAAVLGASTGILVHTLFAAVGLSALLAASATAFEVLKWLGALYLAWLALDCLRRGSALSVEASGEGSAPRLRRTYVTALGVNLLNPKVVLFFVTFLPQFVDARDPHAAGKLVFLGLYFLVVSIPICLAMVWGAGALSRWLKARPRVLRGVDYACAALFGGFAARLVLARA
jgi:threonine/homoserine/homoserine lactone efflux protein